ncbi:tol-pal system protein YbgF [Desulfocurvus vexinensis]|uniref:tol-pal system protein YbgF n=1 Tax=Desulfocurvus vexinensis TaxID=399548 RepID=UPI0004B54B37|nr:tol-pal system protein YbgF [Desulfocurvus vexinensis]
MLHLTRLALATLVLAALAGCAGTRGAGPQDSAQATSQRWRLSALEARAMTQQTAQQELDARVDDLERRVLALEARAEAPAPAAPPAPASAAAAAGAPGKADAPGKAMDAEPAAAPAASAPASTAPAAPAAPAPAAAAPAKAAPAAPAKPWEAYPEVRAKGAPKAAAPAKAGAKAAAKAPAPAPRPSASAPATGQADYDAALRLVLAGKAAQGRAALERFLAANPASALAPNARYWLGETYYHEHDDGEAIVAFKAVHQQHPGHDKAAAALLKIGYAYARLGDTANARFYLQVLVQDYPASEAAALARKRLESLK